MKTLRVLFIDDEEWRHKAFEENAPVGMEVFHAWDVSQAMDRIKRFHFDIVFLDHDLTADHHHGIIDKYSGREVAKFIVQQDLPPPLVVVHSHNPSGADAIGRILQGHTTVEKIPFRATQLNEPKVEVISRLL